MHRKSPFAMRCNAHFVEIMNSDRLRVLDGSISDDNSSCLYLHWRFFIRKMLRLKTLKECCTLYTCVQCIVHIVYYKISLYTIVSRQPDLWGYGLCWLVISDYPECLASCKRGSYQVLIRFLSGICSLQTSEVDLFYLFASSEISTRNISQVTGPNVTILVHLKFPE